MFQKILYTIGLACAIIVGAISFYGRFYLAKQLRFISLLVVVALCGWEIYKIWKK